MKINDINFLQGVETISVMTDINSIETTKVGYALQNIIQEINNSIELKEGFNFVKKLKESLNSQHVFKLEEMGVNFNVISLNHKSVMKHVLEVLVDLLSNYSSKSYAMLIINNTINEIDSQYHLSRYIQIKTEDFTEENYPISIKSDINSVGYIELGRGIQKVIEKITEKIGEEAGENFIDNFKTKLGEAYLAKLEKMGVNFHLIQLRKNLLF